MKVAFELPAAQGEKLRQEAERLGVSFLGRQAFNVFWTLMLAYVLFGGTFFAVPEFR
jgi:hypothetical protein